MKENNNIFYDKDLIEGYSFLSHLYKVFYEETKKRDIKDDDLGLYAWFNYVNTYFKLLMNVEDILEINTLKIKNLRKNQIDSVFSIIKTFLFYFKKLFNQINDKYGSDNKQFNEAIIKYVNILRLQEQIYRLILLINPEFKDIYDYIKDTYSDIVSKNCFKENLASYLECSIDEICVGDYDGAFTIVDGKKECKYVAILGDACFDKFPEITGISKLKSEPLEPRSCTFLRSNIGKNNLDTFNNTNLNISYLSYLSNSFEYYDYILKINSDLSLDGLDKLMNQLDNSFIKYFDDSKEDYYFYKLLKDKFCKWLSDFWYDSDFPNEYIEKLKPLNNGKQIICTILFIIREIKDSIKNTFNIVDIDAENELLTKLYGQTSAMKITNIMLDEQKFDLSDKIVNILFLKSSNGNLIELNILGIPYFVSIINNSLYFGDKNWYQRNRDWYYDLREFLNGAIDVQENIKVGYIKPFEGCDKIMYAKPRIIHEHVSHYTTFGFDGDGYFLDINCLLRDKVASKSTDNIVHCSSEETNNVYEFVKNFYKDKISQMHSNQIVRR